MRAASVARGWLTDHTDAREALAARTRLASTWGARRLARRTPLAWTGARLARHLTTEEDAATVLTGDLPLADLRPRRFRPYSERAARATNDAGERLRRIKLRLLDTPSGVARTAPEQVRRPTRRLHVQADVKVANGTLRTEAHTAEERLAGIPREATIVRGVVEDGFAMLGDGVNGRHECNRDHEASNGLHCGSPERLCRTGSSGVVRRAALTSQLGGAGNGVPGVTQQKTSILCT